MIELIIEVIKRVLEKEETSRKFAVTLADSYLRRISRFQDQLVLLGVSLNLAAFGFVLFVSAQACSRRAAALAAVLAILLANLLLAKLYSNEHLTTKLLFSRYPELELIMVGDKSWSNFRVLAAAYKWTQTGWVLCASALSAFSAGRFFGC